MVCDEAAEALDLPRSLTFGRLTQLCMSVRQDPKTKKMDGCGAQRRQRSGKDFPSRSCCPCFGILRRAIKVPDIPGKIFVMVDTNFTMSTLFKCLNIDNILAICEASTIFFQ
jgi:hypothetical protein